MPFFEIKRPAVICLSVVAMVTACQQQTPKGQVLAVVNGQEVTAQDVATERRNTPGGAEMSTPAALQKVVTRVLLAQAAHQRKLDAGPDYPADLAQLQQDFLARRMLEATVKAPPAPTPTQIAQTIASHPYQFAQRSRVQVRQLGFQNAAAWAAVHNLTDLAAVAARLNSLGITFEQRSRTIDTADLPLRLAGIVGGQPLGRLFFIREGDLFAALQVTSRSPVTSSPADQEALAAVIIQRDSAQQQTQALIASLGKAGKIVYQPGFQPPSTPAGK